MVGIVVPKAWQDDHFPIIRAELKKSSQLEGKELDELTNSVLRFNYAKSTVNQQGILADDTLPMSGVSGVSFSLMKAQKFQAVDKWSFKNDPVVQVDCYEEGKFVGREVVAAPDVLKSPDKYDVKTFMLLIHALSDQVYSVSSKRVALIADLASEIKARVAEEEKARKELEKKAGLVQEKQPAGPSNWELKDRFFFGKSVFLLPGDEPKEQE